MEEDIALMLTRAAEKKHVDLNLIRKKLLSEISEICYQDGVPRNAEKFIDLCVEAIERGERLLHILGKIILGSEEASKAASLSSTIQYSSEKSVAWLTAFEGDSYKVFTAPLNKATHMIALGEARTIPTFRLPITKK